MNVNETLEMVVNATNDSYANLRKLAELNLATWDKLVAKQMELMTMCLDAGNKQYEAMQGAKRPDEVMGNQMAMARECGEKMMAKNREMVDLLVSTRDEYQGWVEESVKQLKDQFTTAGETVRKSARKAA